MSAFEDDLKTAFAAKEPPADDAFTQAVAQRVRANEKWRALATQALYAGYAVSAAAMVCAASVALNQVLPLIGLGPPAKALANGPINLTLLPMIVAGEAALLGIGAAAVLYLRARD